MSAPAPRLSASLVMGGAVRRRAAAGLRAALGVIAWLALGGCMGARYLPQATAGQLRLMTGGERLAKVVADPDVPPATARLLAEVPAILEFGARSGLTPRRSYRRYVALESEAVVWFVTGSQPLAFAPKVYWFPIAGSFAGVGWFREERAARHVERLERRGWDAAYRGASAYSTGGWFRDPVVSSMLVTGPEAVGELANVLLHESVHATLLIAGQTTFNESMASFVADTMTSEYLAERFGPSSPELREYAIADARGRARRARVLEAYESLEDLYASARPPAEKVVEKGVVLRALARDLELEVEPNNASLLGAKLYGTGEAEFRELYAVCQRRWPRFLAAVASLRGRDFGAAQSAQVEPVVTALVAWNCAPLR